MEHKQFTTDDLNHSPCSNQVFQSDRFTKKTNNLSIPDTILENCSGELSGECLKMEDPKSSLEAFSSDDDKENIHSNQQVINNEPLNISGSLAIDNSYIRRCERNLLESSCSDEQKNSELNNKSLVSRHLLEIQSRSATHNDTISTPPSLLRKEISMLRKEMAEAHEFHDFEIKVLQEENSGDVVESEKYIELFEKYSALVDLYSNLKTELDEYRKNQEKMGNELQSKTADYLESLCSQIETSDNSLNFSSSFISFSGGLKSSTMMEGVSEMEATVVHDGTVLASDPLSISGDNGAFKTPMQTPLRSAKKLFMQELRSSGGKPCFREAEGVIGKPDATSALASEYDIQLLNLETAFYDKVREVEDLEQRLFKLEDMSVVLHSELERMSSVYEKDNNVLRENLSLKTEQLNELTQRLLTEIISLDPTLRNSLVDVSGTKLLAVFIETIMENCRKIKNEDQLTTIENLRNQLSSQEAKLIELEELKKKLSDAENMISIREEEIRMLQSHVSNVRQTREDLASAKEVLTELDSKLKAVEAEKTAAESRCRDLETINERLMREIGENQTELSLARDRKSEIQDENVRLKELYDSLKAQVIETEAILKSNETEIIALKENLMTADTTMLQLKSQLKSMAEEKSELDKRCEQLQESNQNLKSEITEAKNPDNNPEYEKVRIENEDLKGRILESEKLMSYLETDRKHKINEVEELMREIERVKRESLGFSRALENVEKSQKNLAELVWNVEGDGDLPGDRVTKLIQSALIQDSFDAREMKIISVFVETITKTCKEVQNELIRNFDSKKVEWETERNLDLNLIKSLKEEIKTLGDKSERNEAKIREILLEKEDLMKLHENLKNQMAEAEKIISACSEEMKEFKARENVIKKMQDDLSAADEIIARLNAQVSALKSEKLEAEQRSRELEGSLQSEINAAEATKKELNEMKMTKEKLENESDDLKLQILESKEAVGRLQEVLEGNRQQQADREQRIKDLESEIDVLKKEGESFSEKLQNLDSVNKQLRDVLSDVQSHLYIPDSTLAELLSGAADNKKILSEKISSLIKVQVEELKAEQRLSAQEAHQIQLDELRKACEALEEKLTDATKTISAKEEDIQVLQLNIKETREEFSCAKTTLVSLKEQVERNETGRREAENRCGDLEIVIANLKNEIEISENLQKELQIKLSDAREKSENDLKSYDALKSQIIEAESTISTRDEEIRVLKAEKSSLEIQLDELRKTCMDLNAKLFEAESKTAAQEERIKTLLANASNAQDSLASANEALDSKLKAIEGEKAAAEARCHDLETVSESLKREIEASQKLGKELQTQLEITLEKKSRAEKENARLMELCNTLEVQVTELGNEIQILKSNENQLEVLKATCEDLKTRLQEAESTISAQEEQIKTLETERERSREEISSARAALLEVETQLAADKNRCRELEKIVENLEREIDAKENLRTELKSEKSKIETENVHLKESYDALKAQMAEAESAIFDREEQIRALRSYESQFTAIKENLASADETILKLKSQLKSVENEKSEMENRCSELQESNQNLRVEITSARNLENNPAYEKMQIENDGLKQRVFEYEKMMADLKTELVSAKENQMNNIFKMEELIREVEELKRENTGFSHALFAIEETQRNLVDVLSDVGNDGDLPGDRVTKIIAKTSKVDSTNTRETKIVSDFVETVSKTCKGVQNELIKKFDSKKLEWETQKDVDLRNLQKQIELLTEKNVEIEGVLRRGKEELAEAEQVIQRLKCELSSAQTEKVEIEYRCRKLEEGTLRLQAEIDTKETIIKGLDELKVLREKLETENDDLKKRILESEEVAIRLKKSLKIAQDEQTDKESRIKDCESEIVLLKKEKESLMGVSGELKNLEKTHRNLVGVLSDVQAHLDLPEDTLTKLLSDEFKNRKIFIERILGVIATQTNGLKVENKNLKLGNDSLKERVKQLTKIIEETAGEPKEDLNFSNSLANGMNLRSKPGKRMDRYARRLDKLEEINHNLTELLIRILTTTEYPDLEKLNLSAVGDFSKVMKKVLAHVNTFLSNVKELKEENSQLDEECETYSNIIKDLKKEAAAVWKSNREQTEAMEAEINRLKEEKNSLENEKQDLVTKIAKLDVECQRLQSASKTEGSHHSCTCGNDSKKINELKRTILVKEQKLLELQDLEAQTSSLKSQIEYLKTSLEREKKKTAEEKEKNKKLQNQLNEAAQNEKTEKKSEENQVLEELRMRGSISGGIVQEFGDKEKMRKLAKDIAILKELCRARYAEIKRLEAVNAVLRNSVPKLPSTPKNSNQMDSPIRSRGYNTRSKNQVRDVWKSEIIGKENGGL